MKTQGVLDSHEKIRIQVSKTTKASKYHRIQGMLPPRPYCMVGHGILSGICLGYHRGAQNATERRGDICNMRWCPSGAQLPPQFRQNPQRCKGNET